MKINYYECKHSQAEEWQDERTTAVYPCNHPENQSMNCPLDNKMEGQEVDCFLITAHYSANIT